MPGLQLTSAPPASADVKLEPLPDKECTMTAAGIVGLIIGEALLGTAIARGMGLADTPRHRLRRNPHPVVLAAAGVAVMAGFASRRTGASVR